MTVIEQAKEKAKALKEAAVAPKRKSLQEGFGGLYKGLKAIGVGAAEMASKGGKAGTILRTMAPAAGQVIAKNKGAAALTAGAGLGVAGAVKKNAEKKAILKKAQNESVAGTVAKVGAGLGVGAIAGKTVANAIMGDPVNKAKAQMKDQIKAKQQVANYMQKAKAPKKIK